MTGVVGLDHVQVAAPAGCEAAARAFYGKILGFHEVEKPLVLALRGGCWFTVGVAELHIGVEEPFRPAAKAHPAFRVGDVHELARLAESLQSEGVEVCWADDGEIPGRRRFHASDPWGNRLEFIAGVESPA